MTDTCIKLLIFLSGVLLGHWLSIYRDWRREFNEIADRVSGRLQEQVTSPSPIFAFPAEDIRLIRRLLNRWSLWRFDVALRNYHEATNTAQQRYEDFTMHYTNTEEVAKATQRLLAFLKHK